MLEKELILEEEARLTDRVKKKVELGQADTLQLAKQVNEYQRKLQDTTRKMMGLVSELSMNQAETMKLQQEVQTKRSCVEDAYRRLDVGLPPNDESQLEWERLVREDELKNSRTLQKQQVCDLSALFCTVFCIICLVYICTIPPLRLALE